MDDSLLALKQDLNRIIGRVILKRPVLDLFLDGITQLIKEINPEASEEKIQLHLQTWVAGTAFVMDHHEPESYSSPICYASASGLREGFDTDESSELNQNLLESLTTYDSALKPEDSVGNPNEAVQITRLWVAEVVRTWQEKQPLTFNDVTKQIELLVYQLYGLKPMA
ncbi:hypothetical protein HUW51_17550 [Adhaeribacter swui]|uniref:Uncharacterized protein n=1 Tax=Adhaeribacter swui TaxID=2086471 RepID=A0A7G7GBA7_9BACT|nr:hypothetical protein [Adhaeribacter swui]QNF34441.1 hypothetical protein HUW51_17550 [Adhaeribacter swui]